MDRVSCLWATKFLLCSRGARAATCKSDHAKESSSHQESRPDHNYGPSRPTGNYGGTDEAPFSAVRRSQGIAIAWCCKGCWRSWWGPHDSEDSSIVKWYASWYSPKAGNELGGASAQDKSGRHCIFGCRRRSTGFFVGLDAGELYAYGHQPAESSFDTTGGTPGGWGPIDRTGVQLKWKFHVHKRRRKTREDAARLGRKNLKLLPPDPATALQANAPDQDMPSECRGPEQNGSLSHVLLGEVQDPEGGGADALDFGPCGRLRISRWLRRHQGVPRTLRGNSRAERVGRQLVIGLHSVPHGGSSSAALCRTDELHGCHRSPLCASHTPKLGCNKSGVHHGARSPDDQEGRAQEDNISKFTKGRRPSRSTEPQAEGEVPSKAESWGCRQVGGVADGEDEAEFKSPSAAPGLDRHYDAGNDQQHFETQPNDVKQQKRQRPSAMHEMSYPKWCALLTANVLKTRTPFAWFLSCSISLHRVLSSRGPSTPAFFPVPAPLGVHHDRMPKGCSSRKRHMIHLKRAVHCITMALNFWYFDGGNIDKQQLWREPNAEHRALYARIEALIKSDGQAETFPMAKSGRKSPELIARLGELSNLLTARGIGNTSYEKTFAGVEVPREKAGAPEINPFSDLNTSRLLLHGTGHWDVTSFLDDELKMPYRDPDCLLCNLVPGERPAIRDPPEEVAKLAKLWDVNNLLLLHQNDCKTGSLVKVFNPYKGPSQDRQIGDRRGRNSLEAKVEGPSKNLPAGCDVMDLFVPVATHKAVVAISDRRDQIWVTQKRALSNTVGPGIPIEYVQDTDAYSLFLLEQSKSKTKRNRESAGDHLEETTFESEVETLPAGCIWPAFKSILQGDHCGVEIATSAHASLLESYGLLSHDPRLVATRCLQSSNLLQGLVIDDYFAVSIEERGADNVHSQARKCYDRAQEAYSKWGLLGSPAKDVTGENTGKVVGASINSSNQALDLGLCNVGAPAAKRMALSFITLACAQLAYTSDSLHLCLVGGWVAVLSFRRPLMSLLNKSFHLVDQCNFNPNSPKLVALSRRVANELVLLAVLAPLAISDLGAEYLDRIYCTDASIDKGAICSAPISKKLNQVLWRACRSKGSYSRLLSTSEAVLKRAGLFEEERLLQNQPQRISRPLAFHYDFIEVFAGASAVTKAVSDLGFTCGPPLDLSLSEEYNLTFVHVIEWISCLIADGRLRSFHLSPPCTTFSIMRRPRLRSPACPFGFDVRDPQTRLGTLLACRALQLLCIGAVNGAGHHGDSFLSLHQALAAVEIG